MRTLSDIDLPQSVLDRVEFAPSEDILLDILRNGLPDVPIYSLIPEDAPSLFLMARRMSGLGLWRGDSRFTDYSRCYVHTFTTDPDGDEKGAMVSEAVRTVLRDAWLGHVTIPGKGSVISITMLSEPSRKTDWATSAGPVQYADLPTGYWRYETVYGMEIRKPL